MFHARESFIESAVRERVTNHLEELKRENKTFGLMYAFDSEAAIKKLIKKIQKEVDRQVEKMNENPIRILLHNELTEEIWELYQQVRN